MITPPATNAPLGLRIAETTEATSREIIRNSAQHEREIAYFRDNIANVQSVDDLMGDQRLYSFVMRAFDLEDQIFGKALMSKMLKSDISDRSALVNRLTDPRFKEIYEAFNFTSGGERTYRTESAAWVADVEKRYVTRQFLNGVEKGNPTVARALEFREKAGGVKNAYDILKDADLSEVVRVAFGIPSETAGLDIDKQAQIIADKLDLETLSDPDEIARIMNRYTIIADAQSGAAAAANTAVQLLQPYDAAALVTIDLEAISALPRSPYG